MERLKGTIKEKDLEQLAVVREMGIKYLVSYDEDFIEQEEYTTPKEIIERIGRKCKKTDY